MWATLGGEGGIRRFWANIDDMSGIRVQIRFKKVYYWLTILSHETMSDFVTFGYTLGYLRGEKRPLSLLSSSCVTKQGSAHFARTILNTLQYHITCLRKGALKIICLHEITSFHLCFQIYNTVVDYNSWMI